MKKIGGDNYGEVQAIEFVEKYLDKPIDARYGATRVIDAAKGNKMHIFENLQNKKETFGIFGFGLMNKHLQTVTPGTPLRVVYLGKKDAKIDGETRQCHQVDVYDITEEVESGKITATVL
jgi:hypothetical protein